MPFLTLAAEMGPESLVRDLLVVLATAALVAMAMQRLRLAVVPAYLIAGALVGPGALRFVASPDSLNAISHLATILLMFGIGLQLHLDALKGSMAAMLTAGVGSTIASTLIGWPLAMLFGLSPPAALAISMALSISCTSVVLRLISERRELGRPNGRLSLAILVIQDLMVLAMLALMPLLSSWAAGGSGAEPAPNLGGHAPAAGGIAPEGLIDFIGGAALKIGGVSALIVFGKAILPRLLAEAARGKSGEVMMILSLAAAIGAAVVTSVLGFSPELGAFLAGFLLSATPFRYQLSGQIGPLRDLFMAVFFTTVGMSLDPRAAAGAWWVVLLGCAVMFAVKTFVIGASCWSVGATATVSVRVGMSLAQAGEFSLVILPIALAQKIISPEAEAEAIAVVILSLILTPTLVQASRRVAPLAGKLKPAPWIRFSRLRDEGAHSHAGHHDHAGPHNRADVESEDSAILRAPVGAGGEPLRKKVIIAGFGPVGRAVVEKLAEVGVEYTIVELNTATVKTQEKLGRHIIYGDITNAEVLESAGLREADAVVITIPDEDAALRACQTVRQLSKDVFIAVRTDFMGQGMMAKNLGADYVIADEIATAEAMRVAVLDRLGFYVEKTDDQKKRASVSLRSTRLRKK